MTEKLENNKYFSSGLIFLFLAQAIFLIIRMGSRIIIARFSSPEIYGSFSVIWNEMTLISTLALLGLGQQLTIDLPRQKGEKKKENIKSALVYATIMGAISFIIAIIFYFLNNGAYKYSFLLATFYVVFLFFQFIFIGLKDFRGYFIQVAIQSISMFILIVILRNILTIEYMAYVTFGSIGIAVLISAIYLLIKIKSVHIILKTKVNIFDFSKKRMNLFLVDITTSVIFYLVLKLPQIIISSSYAGFVSVALSIIYLLLRTPQIIAEVLGPKISQYYHKSEYDKLQNSFRTAISLVYVIVGPLIIIFSYFGDFFIDILYGAEYFVGARIIFYGFLLAIIIDSFNYVYAIYIRNTDNEKLFTIGKIISLLFFVIPGISLLFILKNNYEISIPIAYLSSTLSLLVFNLIIILKLNKKYNNSDTRKLISWIAFMLFNSILALISIHFIQNRSYNLLILIANIIVYVIYLLISKTVNIKSIFFNIKEMISELFQRSNIEKKQSK